MMKFATFAAIFLLSGALCVSAEKGMSETGKAFVKAFEANDLEAVMALYAPDAELFPPDAMLAKGKDAIRASYAGLMSHYTIKEIIIVEAEHETHGDLSYSWGIFKLTLVPKPGGEPIVGEGRFTDISKRINGKWQYIVDHASYPLPPAPQTAPSK